MPKCRALFIVPSLRRGGAEVQIVQLVNGLPGSQFEKHLISYVSDDELRDQLDVGSVNYHHFRRTKKLDLNVAKQIAQVIDEESIEIVHCTLENALLYGTLAKHYAKRDPSLVCAIHTTRQPSWKHLLGELFISRYLLRHCDQVWFMCKTQALLWIERMPFLLERHHVVYNGVDCERFDPSRFVQAGVDFRENLGIPEEAKVLCCVAGLRPEKLHTDLFRSFKKLRKTLGENCYLLLAGTGPMKSELENLATKLDLGEKVRFLGGLSDVRPLLAASDCKVLCSAAETFSMAMLEAMAMRVPVLATRVGGCGDAITDGKSGVLITPGNVSELAEKLNALLSDPSGLSKMGHLARRTVSERFSYSTMIAQSADNLASIGARS